MDIRHWTKVAANIRNPMIGIALKTLRPSRFILGDTAEEKRRKEKEEATPMALEKLAKDLWPDVEPTAKDGSEAKGAVVPWNFRGTAGRKHGVTI